jgi:hypothetical protein
MGAKLVSKSEPFLVFFFYVPGDLEFSTFGAKDVSGVRPRGAIWSHSGDLGHQLVGH